MVALICISNAPGVPIATSVMYPLVGCLLSPLVAALAMSLSVQHRFTHTSRRRP